MRRRYEFNDNTRIDVVDNEGTAILRVYVHKDQYNLREELQSEELRKRVYNIVADMEPRFYDTNIAEDIHQKWMTRFIAWNDIYDIQEHSHHVINEDNNVDVWFHIDDKIMMITWLKC